MGVWAGELSPFGMLMGNREAGIGQWGGSGSAKLRVTHAGSFPCSRLTTFSPRACLALISSLTIYLPVGKSRQCPIEPYPMPVAIWPSIHYIRKSLHSQRFHPMQPSSYTHCPLSYSSADKNVCCLPVTPHARHEASPSHPELPSPHATQPSSGLLYVIPWQHQLIIPAGNPEKLLPSRA